MKDSTKENIEFLKWFGKFMGKLYIAALAEFARWIVRLLTESWKANKRELKSVPIKQLNYQVNIVPDRMPDEVGERIVRAVRRENQRRKRYES